MIKLFDTKLINGTEFNDYLNLSSKPIYLNIDEGKKNQNLTVGKMNEHNLGVLFLEIPKEGFIKVESLNILAYELRKYNFIFDKNWKKDQSLYKLYFILSSK